MLVIGIVISRRFTSKSSYSWVVVAMMNITSYDEPTQVERHMMDGDVILFNRQPSLHKMSMMVSCYL